MDIQSEKLELINWLTSLNDQSIIAKIKALRSEKEETSLSSEHKNILDQRLASHSEDPEKGSSWEEVKQRIGSK